MTQQRRGPKPNQARREMISRLRESGYTMRQIGAALEPPCSYEAVRLALQKIEADKKGLTIKRKVY